MKIHRELVIRETEAAHLHRESDVDSLPASPWHSNSPHDLFVSILVNERLLVGIGSSLLLGDNAFYVRARFIPIRFYPILLNHFHTTCTI
jgi:hypothetical protein